MLSTTALSALLLPGLALAAPACLVSRQESGGSYIHPNGDTSQCLSVPPTRHGMRDGNLVESVACDSLSSEYLGWDLSRGRGHVKLHGTNFCLDAGTNPHNNVQMKIWTCYDGLQQQDWYYTDDNRIAIYNGDQCLDLGGDIVQTYKCTPYNTNQVWTVGDADSGSGGATSSSSSVVPSSTSSSSIVPSSTSSATNPGPTGTYTGIHPKGVEGQCVSIPMPFANGNLAVVYPCNGGEGQNFELSRGSTKIHMRSNPDFCLDAGTDPHNNVALKIWKCYDGLAQQQWYFTDDGRIAIEGGNQCADLRDGSLAGGNTVQTYQCTTGNNNQFFTAAV